MNRITVVMLVGTSRQSYACKHGPIGAGVRHVESAAACARGNAQRKQKPGRKPSHNIIQAKSAIENTDIKQCTRITATPLNTRA